jgi:uncharacterized protein with GYD domain
MNTYIILSQLSADALRSPKDLAALAKEVAKRIKAECPNVKWKDSYATLGSVDVVDIVEAPTVEEVARAALIIRSHGHAMTQTLPASEWHGFVEAMKA